MASVKAKDDGLNIEGLAWDHTQGQLLLGLRSPVVDGNALLVPLRLRDPRGPFSYDNLEVKEAIRLPLGGFGIRSVEYDPQQKVFYIIAGATETQGQFRLADDFTVPAGPGWTVNFVELHAYQTNAPATPSPFTAATVQIWGPCTPGTVPGAAGCTAIAFGDTTTNRLVSSTDATLFRAFNTVAPPPGTPPGTTRKVWRQQVSLGVSLAPGYYWVDWSTTTFNAGAHFAPSITVPGSRGLPGWNARQFAVATSTWAAVIDAGNPASAPDVPQDQTFELYGMITPVELQSFEIK